jgi:hypothetical protein
MIKLPRMSAAALVILMLAATTASGQATRRTETSSRSTTIVNDASPSCVPSTRTAVTLEETIGPACIGIGNRDIANPAPACGGSPPAVGVNSPSRGDAFIVVVGSINLNTNFHTDIVNCTSPRVIPAIGSVLLALMASLLGILGIVRLRRDSRR